MNTAPIYHEISTAPDNGQGYFVQASDGVQLRIGSWPARDPGKGTVLLFPGRGDYIELYGPAIDALTTAGYAVLAIDWRGHGLSERIAKNDKVGHVESFSDYQLDVKALLNCAEEMGYSKPLFLVAHSMGACIALRALVEGLDVRAAAFSAPMFDIHMATYERYAAWPLTWAMSAVGKGETYAPGFDDRSYVFRHDFDGNTLTNSEEEYERWIEQGIAAPELHTGGPSMGWLFAALKETRALAQTLSPPVPCLAFCGDQEETVDVPAIRRRMTNWKNGRLIGVQGAKHELFLELPAVRQKVLREITSFFGGLATEQA